MNIVIKKLIEAHRSLSTRLTETPGAYRQATRCHPPVIGTGQYAWPSAGGFNIQVTPGRGARPAVIKARSNA